MKKILVSMFFLVLNAQESFIKSNILKIENYNYPMWFELSGKYINGVWSLDRISPIDDSYINPKIKYRSSVTKYNLHARVDYKSKSSIELRGISTSSGFDFKKLYENDEQGRNMEDGTWSGAVEVKSMPLKFYISQDDLRNPVVYFDVPDPVVIKINCEYSGDSVNFALECVDAQLGGFNVTRSEDGGKSWEIVTINASPKKYVIEKIKKLQNIYYKLETTYGGRRYYAIFNPINGFVDEIK